MNKKTIIFLIVSVLMFFVLIKVVVAQLYAPTQNNVVMNVVSNAISTPVAS